MNIIKTTTTSQNNFIREKIINFMSIHVLFCFYLIFYVNFVSFYFFMII